MTKLTGNTFAVKEALKVMGAQYDPDEKCWWIQDKRAGDALSLIKKAGPKFNNYATANKFKKLGYQPGVCKDCGKECKYPFVQCWDCKTKQSTMSTSDSLQA